MRDSIKIQANLLKSSTANRQAMLILAARILTTTRTQFDILETSEFKRTRRDLPNTLSDGTRAMEEVNEAAKPSNAALETTDKVSLKFNDAFGTKETEELGVEAELENLTKS